MEKPKERSDVVIEERRPPNYSLIPSLNKTTFYYEISVNINEEKVKKKKKEENYDPWTATFKNKFETRTRGL